MTKTRVFFYAVAAAFVVGVFLPTQPQCQTNDDVVSAWQGVMEVSGVQLTLIFHIGRDADNNLQATMDSPDQGISGITVDEVICDKRHLRLEIKAAMAFFEGDFSADCSRIIGEWNQGGMSIPLELERLAEAPKVNRPQEPKPPFPYSAEEVAYESTQPGITLAGTLTCPETGGPFPAVLLISGSGAQDRDEALIPFNHRPFLVLADYLTRNGIAVLRVDDRGVGGSTGGDSDPTSEDFAADVLAGVEFLKGRKEINPNRIGLAGHSEGGIIAPMVAVKSPDVAFIILMAGTGVTGEEVLLEQGALVLKAEGAGEEKIALQISLQEEIFAIIKEEKDDAVAKEKISRLLRDATEKLIEEDSLAIVDDIETYIENQTQIVLSPWMRYFVTYDPGPTLTKVKCPVLAIIGEKDLQVPPKQNLPAIESALKAGGNEDYTVKELPGLNHLFQTAETGAVSEYGKIEETMSPAAMELIADWILARNGGK